MEYSDGLWKVWKLWSLRCHLSLHGYVHDPFMVDAFFARQLFNTRDFNPFKSGWVYQQTISRHPQKMPPNWQLDHGFPQIWRVGPLLRWVRLQITSPLFSFGVGRRVNPQGLVEADGDVTSISSGHRGSPKSSGIRETPVNKTCKLPKFGLFGTRFSQIFQWPFSTEPLFWGAPWPRHLEHARELFKKWGFRRIEVLSSGNTGAFHAQIIQIC